LALDNPDRIATLVLLNSYYHWTAGLRRPRAIALYSTPTVRTAARAIVRLDGVGHYVQVDQPQQVADLIARE